MCGRAELVKAFARLAHPEALRCPTDSFDAFHDLVLNGIVFDPHLSEYPPSPDYKIIFLKWVLKNLERLAANKDVEIDSRIYDLLISCMNSSSGTRSAGAPRPSYITHYWSFNVLDPNLGNMTVDEKATLLESRTMIEQGTTGLKTWPASFVLADFLVGFPELVSNKRVLEFGSGAGLLGIIVAAIQVHYKNKDASLWLTDVNDEVIARCRDNLSLPCNTSSSHPNLHFTLLNWSDALDTQERPIVLSLLDQIGADLVLGADIVYDPSLIPSLIAALSLALLPALNREPKTAILSLTIRSSVTHKQFLDAAEQILLITELDRRKHPSSFLTTSSEEQEIQLLKLRLK